MASFIVNFIKVDGQRDVDWYLMMGAIVLDQEGNERRLIL